MHSDNDSSILFTSIYEINLLSEVSLLSKLKSNIVYVVALFSSIIISNRVFVVV